MTTTNQVRQTFLDFFAKAGHKVVPSSPLVPYNDPTLMFTNAGMVPFKNYFTGLEKPPYPRAVSSQKCVRAGGKHNDLENVGYTARHHTFFEMLGNFSFGDYFKADAIEHAWTLLTKEFDLPAKRLLATVHTSDEQAATLWKKIAGLSDDRIIRIPTDDNFWSMGDTGPCGPCTEIFYDHGDKIPGGLPGSPEEDGDRFIEIWNLVFMQFEQVSPAERKDLPSPSIDTGMGLERITAVLQGKHNNYEIDMMQALVDASATATGVAAKGEALFSHRVIADHLRAASFLLADGVMPSNEGRGYVLRRIMRRAMRHAHMLGQEEPLIYRLVPALITQMGEAYGELGRAEVLITDTLKREESNFKRTLDKGLKLLDEEIKKVGTGKPLPGKVAFKLYDTFGFPVDLTQDVLKAKKIEVDMPGFEAAMAEQKKKARAAWKGSGAAADEKIWFDLYEMFGATEFSGYAQLESQAKILAIVADGQSVQSVQKDQECVVITNQTPFYGESGGQVGDVGHLIAGGEVHFLHDTHKKFGDFFLHYVRVSEYKGLNVDDEVKLKVDKAFRRRVCCHHSVTHLLHAALRDVLGDHVAQKGSLQSADRTRFDISQPQQITADELAQIEAKVNAEIRANTPVTTLIMTPDEAIKIGAMALFGEKYGEEVRVVSMGTGGTGGTEEGNKVYSLELCGGTHVNRTGDIGGFKIISESAVAAGIRRIEAVAGEEAEHYIRNREKLMNDIAQYLKIPVEEVPARIESLLGERKKQAQEIANLRKKLATGGEAAADVKDIGGIKFTGLALEDVPAKELKPMADELKQKMGSGVVVLVSGSAGKASLVVGVTKDLTNDISAVDLVQVGSEILGGKGGGGRPDMAQAGGTSPEKANDAIAAIEHKLAEKSA